jgi:hypothetical protein
MRISKWHESRGRARRTSKGTNQTPATELHWIAIDGALFERLEAIATARRCSVVRLVDRAINTILDGERRGPTGPTREGS